MILVSLHERTRLLDVILVAGKMIFIFNVFCNGKNLLSQSIVFKVMFRKF